MRKLRIDPRGICLVLVDGQVARREALAGVLVAGGYRIARTASSASDLRRDGEEPADLVLVDLDAPGTTQATLDAIREGASGPLGIPVVGLTDDDSVDGRNRAVELGIDAFLTRPFGDAELHHTLENALTTTRLRRLLGDRSAQLTEALRERTTERDTSRASLSALAAMADYHDDDTDQHAERVGVLAAAIAAEMGLSYWLVSMLREAAPLHDVGKVGISRRILLKPGRLTAQEWIHMQQHVEIGAQILASAGSPVLTLAAEIARTHHERYDGSGYTSGLVGEQIPISGRIVAVADVWDTLTHDRPYRPAWETPRALAEIHGSAGSHFDPRVVGAFSAIELGPAPGPAPAVA